MTSRIFDNSGTGEAFLPVSPVQPQLMMKGEQHREQEEEELSSTLSATDLFALLEGNILPQTVENTSEVPPSPPGEDMLIGDGGSQFLEGFTNLSDYLFAGAQTPVEMTPSLLVPLPFVEDTISVMEAESTTPCPTSTVSTKSSRKRTARDANLDLVIPSTVTPCTSTANTDHDDYVAKKPRRQAAVDASTLLASLTSSAVGVGKGKAAAGKTEPASKEQKYRERRDKNNVASKRSREIRKQKFSAMEKKAFELEDANDILEQKVVELERLTKSMKAILVERLSKSQ